MTREKFKTYMQTLMNFEDWIDSLDKLGISVWESDPVAEIQIAYLDMLRDMFEPFLNVKFDSDISYFLYECERGTIDDPHIEFQGKKYPLSTLDELYDWLEVYREYKESNV